MVCVGINGGDGWIGYNTSLTTPKHSLLTLTAHAKVSTALTAPKAGTVLRLNETYLVIEICSPDVLQKAAEYRQAL